MKCAGIIAEYNPFHNGHKYHLEETKKQTESEAVIVVMSGDFVQRGVPAMLDKYTRTRMALEGGADAVFELPVLPATSSAEIFSEGGISFMSQAGVVDTVCFGAEDASLSTLSAIARILADEPEEYRKILRENLKQGLSYPRAVYGAITRFILESSTVSGSTIEQVYQISSQLAHPNNILGIEYLKALNRLGSSVRPFCIRRIGDHRSQVLAEGEFGSSSAIRESLEAGSQLTAVSRYMPAEAFALLKEAFAVSAPVIAEDLASLVDYVLLAGDGWAEAADMTDEMANRIRAAGAQPMSFSARREMLKSKNLTMTHVSRALLHAVLNISREDMISARANSLVPYARLLGFRESARPLLAEMKKTAQIPVITKVADAGKVLSPVAMKQFSTDLKAHEIYRSLVWQKFGHLLPDDYRAGVVYLKS